MQQRQFQAWRKKSFVDYNTLPMMSDIARKLAMIEQAIKEIDRAEVVLSGVLVLPATKIQAMKDTIKASLDLQKWALEAIQIAKDVKSSSLGFVREQLRKE